MPAPRLYTGVSGLFAVALTFIASAIAEDIHPGNVAFQRCVICHQADGRGIPSAFPPLKGRIARLATLDEGRAYLVAVLRVGLIGPIRVDGMDYFGVMPAQMPGDDYQLLSQVLNYTIEVIDAESKTSTYKSSDDWMPFTVEEVAQLVSAGLPDTMQGVAALRQKLDSQYPELLQTRSPTE